MLFFDCGLLLELSQLWTEFSSSRFYQHLLKVQVRKVKIYFLEQITSSLWYTQYSCCPLLLLHSVLCLIVLILEKVHYAVHNNTLSIVWTYSSIVEQNFTEYHRICPILWNFETTIGILWHCRNWWPHLVNKSKYMLCNSRYSFVFFPVFLGVHKFIILWFVYIKWVCAIMVYFAVVDIPSMEFSSFGIFQQLLDAQVCPIF